MATPGFEPENIAVTPKARQYLEYLLENTLLEGEPGQQYLKSSATPVLHALHQVLGGGTVSVTVDTPGSETVVHDLDDLLEAARDEWNQFPRTDMKLFF